MTASLPPPPLPPPPDILALHPNVPASANPMPHAPSQAPVSPSRGLPSETKSFKDTLVDGSATMTPPLVTYEELEAANKALDSPSPMSEDGPSTAQVKIPKVKIPKEIWQRLCAPWKNAVIIKLLGKSVNFHVLHARLLKDWRTDNEFEVIDVGLGYYIVKFSSPHDYSKVLTGGPYKMFDHYLAVQPWEPGFHPARAKAPKTAVWIKLFGVPILCFYEAICMYLGSKIGKPIKVDPTTLLATRGQFARVCVEVDLSQPLPSSVDLDLEDLPQSLILVEYEGLHRICFHCGEFGHKMEYCRLKNPEVALPMSNPNAKAMVELTQALKPESVDNNMIYGPWMVQQRKQRRRTPQRRPSASIPNDAPTSEPLIVEASNLPPTAQPKTTALDKHVNPVSPPPLNANRFEAIADIMDEDPNLQSSTKGKAVAAAHCSPNDKAVSMLAHTPNDVPSSSSLTQVPTHAQAHNGHAIPTTSVPPPMPSNLFVKPKSKQAKKKTKSLGPVTKAPKNPHPKPYDPPSIAKIPSTAEESELSSNQPPKQPPPVTPSSSVQPPNLMAHSSSSPLLPHSTGVPNLGTAATINSSAEPSLVVASSSPILAATSPPPAVGNKTAIQLENSLS
ncbi:hypothetical protein SLA2020_527230 [Shorea laevis]